MTSITRNLPPFVREIGASIIGKECYVTLVENLELTNIDCLKYALSKGLGIGIVAGGSIMKVPQILLILKAHSARGISLSAYILETLSYAITLAYSYRNNYPFSTYGENLFLTLQNIVILNLIIAYAPRLPNKGQKLFATLVGSTASTAVLSFLPETTLALLQMGTLPLSVFSKLPQIRQNARTQSTGQLSAFAILSQIAGCLARLFTTATEVNDWIVSAGFAVALLLNIILGYQLYAYWPKAETKAAYQMQPVDGTTDSHQPKFKTEPTDENTTLTWTQPVQPLQHRVSTPPPRAQTPTSGKKWTRKVD
ncbi:hypothetical protein M378DRAFT_13569 [Amanita muscaria Koide BX008]|uniref:Mannose-P-dolichol utilization defect 1 protein homolog n=1 Tax=Amanita muscaria (strain Koide BX008) TaxID=946122 RepID=A0A0C2T4D9_AMAMK|nr:hypothetical protein M378DRAFT_82618 [Amanita muscaria Koide BX008]KIL61399.1 hypothetical protein M378DRAFT_13569 [Amanita muscaria Koide BX008]